VCDTNTFFQGDTAKLLDDIAELKPTVFCSVPRLFNRIFDKVLGGVKAKGGLAAYLFNTAYNTKKGHLEKTVNHWLWDRVVFAGVSILVFLFCTN
jgi:long-chain acyl-CoA synthetase